MDRREIVEVRKLNARETLYKRWQEGADPVCLSIEKWMAVHAWWEKYERYPYHLLNDACPVCWDAGDVLPCAKCRWVKAHHESCHRLYRAATRTWYTSRTLSHVNVNAVLEALRKIPHPDQPVDTDWIQRAVDEGAQ